jgi:hypothetical protein
MAARQADINNRPRSSTVSGRSHDKSLSVASTPAAGKCLLLDSNRIVFASPALNRQYRDSGSLRSAFGLMSTAPAANYNPCQN